MQEFPFVEALPKREKSKLSSLWDRFTEFQRQVERLGPPISPALAAALLGLSNQRVAQLIEAGRFQVVESPLGHRVITGNSFVEFCKLERKTGRPTLIDTDSTLRTFKRGLSSLKNNSK